MAAVVTERSVLSVSFAEIFELGKGKFSTFGIRRQFYEQPSEHRRRYLTSQ